MKKKSIILITTLALIIAGGCKSPATSEKGKSAEEKIAGTDNCLTGKWVYIENDFEKSFTFNEDKTGTEVYSADDIRQFTWTIKDGNPVIVYINETAEWAFTLNCEAKELSVFGLVMKKK